MLKLDFSELTYDAKWYDYNGGRLKIRPYPSSLANVEITAEGTVLMSGPERFKVFSYCLEEWDVAGADGKPLKLTDEAKQKVFDFNMAGIPNYVLIKSRQFEAEKERQEKN